MSKIKHIKVGFMFGVDVYKNKIVVDFRDALNRDDAYDLQPTLFHLSKIKKHDDLIDFWVHCVNHNIPSVIELDDKFEVVNYYAFDSVCTDFDEDNK